MQHEIPVLGESIYKKVGGLILISLVSPMAGFALELLLTRRYGNTGVMDAYRITGGILNIGIQLVFVQLLPLLLIPSFTHSCHQFGQNQALRRVWAFGAFLTAGCGLTWVFAFIERRPLSRLLGPGLTDGFEAAVTFVPVMAGALVVLVVCGTLAAVLNCYGVFWTFPVATLIINLAILFCVILMPHAAPQLGISIGILAGSGAALLVHAVCMARVAKRRLPDRADYRDREVSGWKSAWASAPPLLLATVFLHVINILLLRRLSAFAAGSAVVYSFAFRLTTLVSLPAAALVTVAFPRVSSASSSGDSARLSQLTARSLRGILLISVPIVTVIEVLRAPMIEMLAGRSAMSTGAIHEAGSILGILLVGAPTGALTGILQRALVSRGSVWGIAIGAAAALVIVFVGADMAKDSSGIALLWDVAFWLNTAVLLGALIWLDRAAMLMSITYLGKVAFAAATAGVCAWAMSSSLSALGWTLPAILITSGMLSVVAAVASSHWICLSEATEMVRYITVRFKTRLRTAE